MKFINVFSLCLLTISLLVSCGTATVEEETTTTATSTAPVAAAATAISEVLASNAFDSKMSSTENIQLIDVRTPQEYNGGTIGNAVNMNLYDPNFKETIAGLDPNRPVFVFCARGARSATAAKVFKELGFKEIYDLQGGYGAWMQYKQ